MSVVATSQDSNAYETPITSGDDLVYQSVSRAAVGSLVLAALGLLSFLFVGMLLFPAVALLMGISALLAIRKYPNELLGKPLAQLGLAIAGVTLLAAPAYHTYIYLTEVPPGYQRIAFMSLTSPTGAPDLPPPAALALDGQKVFVKGYIHPTSMDSPRAKKFVLVPDLGTCCFGGQPPLTHMIEVTLSGDDYAKKGMRTQKLSGTLRVNRQLKPIEGLEGVYYTLQADFIN
ncbi:MAG: DUF3299 domain-containing protein [Pirellulaceae bacterium]|nr:DUF3299 domain-containing protein [Pirellulaceae bacterium]